MLISCLTLLLGACAETGSVDSETAQNNLGRAPSASELAPKTESPAYAQPDWAVAYGGEFWATAPDSKAADGGAAMMSTGQIIDRVQHAFRKTGEQTASLLAKTYRVEVAPGRVTFSNPADASQQFSWQTESVRINGRNVSLRQPAYSDVLGNVAQFKSENVTEHMLASRLGVELTWIVDKPDKPINSLQIVGRLDGVGQAESQKDGIRFNSPSGDFAAVIGNVTVVDAAGTRWPVEGAARGASFVIDIPEDILASAAYPLAIDPGVYPSFAVDNQILAPAPDNQYYPSIASNGLTTYLVVWEDHRWNGLSKVYGARYNAATYQLLDPYGIEIVKDEAISAEKPSVAWQGSGGNGAFVVAFRYYDSEFNFHYAGVRRVLADGSLPESGITRMYQDGTNDSDVVISCSSSNCLVVWGETNTTTSLDVVGSMVDVSNGAPVPSGSEIGVSAAAGNQGEAAIAFDGTNYMVVWSDWRSGEMDLYNLRVDQTGTPVSGEPINGRAIVTATQNQSAPAITFGASEYLVVWSDNRAGDSVTFEEDIYGMFVGSDGLPIGTANGWRIYDGTYRDRYPDAAYNGNAFLVAWEHDPFYGLASDAMAIVLGANGVPTSSAFALSNSAANEMTLSVAASRLEGGAVFLTAWSDARDAATGTDIYGVFVFDSGVVSPPTTEASLLVSQAVNDQSYPSLATDGVDFLLVWDDNRNGTDTDIWATRIDSAGNITTPNGIEIDSTAGDQSKPVAAFGGEYFLIVWEHDPSGAADIVGRTLSSANAVGSPVNVAVKSGAQTNPAICFDQNSKWLVAWEDTQLGVKDIFAGRVQYNAPGKGVAIADPLDGEGLGINARAGVQSAPDIAFNNGKWFVAYLSGHNYGWREVYGTTVTSAGVVENPTLSEIAIATGYGYRYYPQVAAKGSTDYFVSWADFNPGSTQIKGIAVSYSGDVPAEITFVQNETGMREYLDVVAYGTSSYLATWMDMRNDAGDIYIARLLPGETNPSPDGNGMVVSAVAGMQMAPRLLVNNLGQALITYSTQASGVNRIVANRVCIDCCQIDGVAYADGETNPENDCEICDSSASSTSWSTTSGSCDDDNACTYNDSCNAGVCEGTPYQCNDDDECTDDICQGDGTCDFPHNTAPCDDGIDCTDDDVCNQGICEGTPQNLNCDDGVPCTTNLCNPYSDKAIDDGCVYEPNDGACDDAFTCTVNLCDPNDIMADSEGCVALPMAEVCDDGTACTVDVCDPSAKGIEPTTGCVNTPSDVACSDGHACTTDICQPDNVNADALSGCVITPVDLACDDGATCTANFCDPEHAFADAQSGCVSLGNNSACTDSYGCTVDVCNPTAQNADPTTGCVQSPDAGACNDNISCTLDACLPGQVGSDPTSGCVNSPQNSACDDSIGCTVTSCDPANQNADGETGCVVTNDNSACDDGATCTSEVCSPGDEGADATSGCVVTANDGACGDEVACTDDVCDPSDEGADASTGCISRPNHGYCDGGVACMSYTCDPDDIDAAEDGCIDIPQNSACDDDNICTRDLCNVDGCSYLVENQFVDCDSENFCYNGECVTRIIGDRCQDPVTEITFGQPMSFNFNELHHHKPLNWICPENPPDPLLAGRDLFVEVTLEPGYHYAVSVTPQTNERLWVGLRDTCWDQECPAVLVMSSGYGQPVTMEYEVDETVTYLFQIMYADTERSKAAGDFTILATREIPVDGDIDTDLDSDDDVEVIDGDLVDGDEDGDMIDGDLVDADEDGDVVDGDEDGELIDGDIVDGDFVDADEDGVVIDGDEVDGDIADGDVTDGDEPDGDTIDGDASTDGDDPTDGDIPSDGDDPADGDEPEDGDEPTDGDVPSDGDEPTDGDTPADGDDGGSGGGGCQSTTPAGALLLLLILGGVVWRRHLN